MQQEEARAIGMARREGVGEGEKGSGWGGAWQDGFACNEEGRTGVGG